MKTILKKGGLNLGRNKTTQEPMGVNDVYCKRH